MYDPSINFSLDMLALESSLTMYEIENGITEEYLNSPSYSDEDYDTSLESTGFAAGLFEDDFVATEGFGETMGKIGKGIKSALITIGGAIQKVFLGLGRKVKAFFQSAIERFHKNQANKSPYIAKILADDPLVGTMKLSQLKTTITNFFKTFNVTIASSSAKILQFVKKINKILNKAAIGNSKNAGNNVTADDLSGISNAYANSNQLKNRNDESRRDLATDEMNEVEAIIENLGESCKGLTSAVNNINSAAKQLGDKRKGDDDRKMTGVVTNGKGETHDTKFKKTVTPKLIMQAIMMDIDISKINETAKTIVTQCSVHSKACESIIKDAEKVSNENADAKAGYRLCRMYLQCSKLFSQISLTCNNLFIFKIGDAPITGDKESDL